MWIGSHVSIAKGFCAAVEASVAMGANTFQFFTRNPRGGNAKALDLEDIAKGRAVMLEKAFGPPVAHAPYTYNLCSARPEVVVFTMAHLEEDFSRLEAMGVDRVVLHPGTHGGQGTETGIRMISENLNQLLPLAEAAGVRILLEGMAGAGSEVGAKFEELEAIIKGCGEHPSLGVCIDSCHMTGAGYDLRQWSAVQNAIEKIIGWQRVGALHLNDTQHGLGSRKDRHARLGEGHLGFEGIMNMMDAVKDQPLPVILETPNDDAGYAAEISWVLSNI
ncbi:MAG TPA: endonuclease IV [Peptococcaceae bacterium]|nr:endonuclease IV [Peptococcaceae bacterium]